MNKNLLKYKVITLKDDGLTVKQISNQLNKPLQTIYYWLKKFKKFGDINFKKRRKCFRKFNSAIYAEILNLLEGDPSLSQKRIARIIKSKFKKTIHRTSISKYLKSHGSYKKAVVKPLLSQQNVAKRKTYCEKYHRQSLKDVIFCDESSFQLFRNTLKVFHRKGNERSKIFQPTTKKKIQVWGAISSKGRLSLVFYEGRLDGERYQKLLEDNLIDNADRLYGINKWRFVQDNAPCHSKEEVKSWIKTKTKYLLEHPPQSPDLNPVEQLWGIIKRKIEVRHPKNLTELKNLIITEWSKISRELIDRLISHLKNRMKKVLENKGQFI